MKENISNSLLETVPHEEIYLELQIRNSSESNIPKGTSSLAQYSDLELYDAMMQKQKLIYGPDDRKDIFEVIDQTIRERAASVAGILDISRVVDNQDGSSTIRTVPFSVAQRLCKQERFYKQPTAPHCSAFLVATDIVATAGHCINSNNLARARFVFGFQMINADQARIKISNENIYQGIQIISRKLDHQGSDYALVKLDRPVTDRKILNLRAHGKINDNESVYVIGHPSGLPLKYADGARVTNNSTIEYFSANLDTYGGNSGSPVFNTDTGEVEGILVRGETDFISVGNCRLSNHLPTTGNNGEEITRVSEFSSELPKVPKAIPSDLELRLKSLEESVSRIEREVKKLV